MRAALVMCLVLLAGCGPALPRYEWRGGEAAVAAMAQRAAAVHAVRATATLILTSADNERVTLDAAIVAMADGPHHFLKIRAWKFGQAVLDLTATPEGVWVADMRQGGTSESKRPPAPTENKGGLGTLKPAHIAQAWALFFGDFFAGPDVHVAEGPGPVMTLTRRDEGSTIACDVDRGTLTAREYRITDETGKLRQTLTLSRYRPLHDEAGSTVSWPMQLIAQGEGRVDVRFDDVEINPELDAAVFTPAKHAVKQP